MVVYLQFHAVIITWCKDEEMVFLVIVHLIIAIVIVLNFLHETLELSFFLVKFLLVVLYELLCLVLCHKRMRRKNPLSVIVEDFIYNPNL